MKFSMERWHLEFLKMGKKIAGIGAIILAVALTAQFGHLFLGSLETYVPSEEISEEVMSKLSIHPENGKILLIAPQKTPEGIIIPDGAICVTTPYNKFSFGVDRSDFEKFLVLQKNQLDRVLVETPGEILRVEEVLASLGTTTKGMLVAWLILVVGVKVAEKSYKSNQSKNGIGSNSNGSQ